MQIQPSIDLSVIVKHYLILKKDDAAISTLRLFSDGNTGIVFSSGGRLSLNPLNILPKSFVYGQISNFKNITCYGPATLFVVVLQPQGLNKLLNIPAVELRDEIISFDELLGQEVNVLAEELSGNHPVAAKINKVEQFFRNVLAKQTWHTDAVMDASISFISKHNGMITVSQLSAYLGYQERQVERKFNQVIGISPKRFCSIVKLHAFLKQLRQSPDQPVSCSGYHSGYYDQAHLIREFKAITGITPMQYAHKASRLAVNFLQVQA